MKPQCFYSVIGKVIDRFGSDILITSVSDDKFEITETVMTGSTFYSWLFNYEGKIKIVFPANVVEEFRGMLRKFDESLFYTK